MVRFTLLPYEGRGSGGERKRSMMTEYYPKGPEGTPSEGHFVIYLIRDETPQASDGCLGQPISNGVYSPLKGNRAIFLALLIARASSL